MAVWAVGTTRPGERGSALMWEGRVPVMKGVVHEVSESDPVNMASAPVRRK